MSQGYPISSHERYIPFQVQEVGLSSNEVETILQSSRYAVQSS